MNSMMLIAQGILRRTRRWTSALTLALDARAARGPHDRRVLRAGGQHHAVAGLQHELPPLPLQDERDGAVDAVQDLLVWVAVRRITIVRPVRPRVARARLPAQGRHEIVQRRHASILRLHGFSPGSSRTATSGGSRAGCARWATTPRTTLESATPSWF